MRYEGYYIQNADKTGRHRIDAWSVDVIKQKIEEYAGYNRNHSFSDFPEYETACVFEYNWINRRVAIHYFSMLDKQWHREKNPLSHQDSWKECWWPIREFSKIFYFFK